MCRHKSSAFSSNTNSASSGARPTGMAMDQQAPVCESPLFGLRRQLTSTSSRDADRQLHANAAQTTDPNESAPLSSVPQQISRQQIHYAFSIMDNNKDGMIDVRELSQMLANLGVPIDEAILSHIMSSVSKKGDHKISEDEFVQWISLFIQVNDQTTKPTSSRTSRPEARSSGSWAKSSAPKSPKGRARATSSCLEAQPSEEALPRNRRGSGSGLALMRSLSGSSLASSDPANTGSSNKQSSATDAKESRANDKTNKRQPVGPDQTHDQDLEARNDLRAAFCVFDLDGDGFITLDEVHEGLKLLGESWSPNELRQLFSKCSSVSASSSSSASAGSGDLSKQRISIDDFVQLLL